MNVSNFNLTLNLNITLAKPWGPLRNISRDLLALNGTEVFLSKMPICNQLTVVFNNNNKKMMIQQ